MIQHQEENLTVFESALFRTTSTVFYNDDLVVLVDPTWLPDEVEVIRKYVLAIKGNRPLYLLFTHSDYDHIIAAEAFPEALTIASEAFVENPKKEEVLKQIKTFDETYYVQRNYPIIYPEINFAVKEEGQQLKVGATTLTFYHAPGHNADGIITIVEPNGIWLAGDYLSNIEFPYLYHSTSDYFATLQKVDSWFSKHAFHLLIPGHGDIAFSVEEVITRKKESIKYLTDLKKSVLEETPFDIEVLWQRYDFPEGMLSFHQGNIQLMKKELNK